MTCEVDDDILGTVAAQGVMMIGEEVFGRLTPDLVPGILDQFRA